MSQLKHLLMPKLCLLMKTKKMRKNQVKLSPLKNIELEKANLDLDRNSIYERQMKGKS